MTANPLENMSPPEARPSKGLIWTGRVISALPILFMLLTGVMSLVSPDPKNAQDMQEKYGYPMEYMKTITIVEIICVLIYAVPQTAVLGAILLTGYLGGAVATHVRVRKLNMAPVAIIVGIFVWLGLFLRNARLRKLLPLRSI